MPRSRGPSWRSASFSMAISGVVINTRISVASWPSSGCCASRGSKLCNGCCLCDGKAFRLHSYGFMKSSNRYGPRRVRDEVSHGARSIVRRGRVFSRRSTLLRRLRRLCCQRKCHQLGGRGKRGSVQLGVIRGDERVGKMYLLCKDCIDLPMCYPNASCPPQCLMDSNLYHLFKRRCRKVVVKEFPRTNFSNVWINVEVVGSSRVNRVNG